MASLGALLVKIGADPSGLERGVKKAQATVGGFQGAVKKANRSVSDLFGGAGIAQLVAGGAIVVGFKKAFEAADRFDASVRQLSATAKITGQNLGFLQVTARDAKEAFGLSSIAANDLTIEVVKLTSKAGQIERTGDAMRAFLDLGAARGMGVRDTLMSVRQAILGIDEGTDKLFNKNPSVIYQEFARSVGISATTMNDGQKAAALLAAAMNDGGKVAGEYARFLESPAGQSERLRIKTEEAAAVIGQAFGGIRAAVLPVLASLADNIRMFVGGIQLLAVDLAVFFAKAKVEWARFKDFLDGNSIADAIAGGPSDKGPGAATSAALDSLRRTMDAAAQVREEIVRTMNLGADITGPTNPLAKIFDEVAESAAAAAKAAKKANEEAGKAVDKGLGFLRAHGRGTIATLAGGAHRQPGSFDHGTGRQIMPNAPTTGIVTSTTGVPTAGASAGASFGAKFSIGLSQMASQAGSQVMDIVRQFGPLAAVGAALKPVFEGLMEALGPVLSTLAEPLRIVGQLLGSVIAPILKLLAPPLRLLATAVSYVVQGFGWMLEGIGKFIDKILGKITDVGDKLKNVGREMQDGAREARRALESTADAADSVTAALLNVPRVVNIAALRYRVAAGGGTTTGGGAEGNGGGGGGGRGRGGGLDDRGDPGGRDNSIIVHGDLIIQTNDPDSMGRAVQQRVNRGGVSRLQPAFR